jgi:hypothetical protein
MTIVRIMKKTQQKSSKNDSKGWNKMVFVAIAVMFAVAMVATYLAPVLEKSQTAQIGNNAVIGYTIRDADGTPILTTDQQLVQGELQKGHVTLLSSGMEIPVGMAISGENIAPIPIIFPQELQNSTFALLGFEINAISQGLVGMHPGETKTIAFNYGSNNFTMNLSAEEANGIGINVTEAQVGDPVFVGFTTSPEIPVGNATAQQPALRLATITAVNPDALVIQYRYGTAEITLNGISNG